MSWPSEKLDVLIDAETIGARVRAMGEEITRDYRDRDLVMIAVLKGSFIFLADLVRSVEADCEVEFLAVSSYGSRTTSSGIVQLTLDLTAPIEGRDVLLVEDIVDTGLTMSYLLENLATRRPASLKVCTLLHKPARTEVEVPIAYKGFTIEDLFVVGYGLDYDQKLRNVPYIGHKVG